VEFNSVRILAKQQPQLTVNTTSAIQLYRGGALPTGISRANSTQQGTTTAVTTTQTTAGKALTPKHWGSPINTHPTE